MSGLPPVALLTADFPGILSQFGAPLWGIFDQNGQPILVSDSVKSVAYSRQYVVSSYPQERGAFESYNKVQRPYDAKVSLLTSQTRAQLLSSIEPVMQSLQLVTVVMPEFSYQSANLLDYSYERTMQNGVTLFTVTIDLKEIRFTGGASFTSAGTTKPVGQIANNAALTPSGGAGAGGTPFLIPGTSTPLGGGGLTPGGGPFLVPGTGTPLAAIDTGSTNAAYPTTSGSVTAIPPAVSTLTIAPESVPSVALPAPN